MEKEPRIPRSVRLELQRQLYSELKEALLRDFRIAYVDIEETPAEGSNTGPEELSTTIPLSAIAVSSSSFRKIVRFLKNDIDDLLETIIGKEG